VVWLSACSVNGMSTANPVFIPSEVLTEQQYERAYSVGYPRTVRFLLSTGVRSDLAEEIAQAAWARGWECRAQLKSAAAVGVWVNTIAKNLVRVDYRRKKATEELNENSAVIQPDYDASEVGEILSFCSPVDRELLKQHYLEGWSSNEIAPRLGISPVSVRVRLLRIKQSLRTAMGLRGVAIPEAA
jgi:RNA polymerase sigma factor (sigma-70 family)